MKRLLYLYALAFTLTASSQTFPVKNVNDEYVIKNLKGSEEYKNNIKEVIRDQNGLYWFQNITNISSFDGVNWKTYKFTHPNGRYVPVRINEIEVTDDGTIWLASAEGMFGFNRRTEKFIPVKQIFPGIDGMPTITNCIYKGSNDYLFVSMIKPGFFIFNWNTGELKRVIIDSTSETLVPNENDELDVTADKRGNYWGLTNNNKGVWCYDHASGKISRSWKGEIFPLASKRWEGRNITGIAYSGKDDALWLSYAPEGILEKIYLSTGKSLFYSFTDELNVRADTNAKTRHRIRSVIVDRIGNEWILVASKYLVKINSDITKFEYLAHDNALLPLGQMDWLLPETRAKSSNTINDENLIWINGDKGLSVIKKRNSLIKQHPFERSSIDSITPEDYINPQKALKSIFLLNGVNDDPLLLQKNAGRPKLIRFDRNFHITSVLFNDKWKQYPAYFNPFQDQQNFYIAMLRPSDEPLDFRNVVVKDFKVDMATMEVQEANLSFSQRVWRYGANDRTQVFWLFSNGYLYSYDPGADHLDSIFISKPLAKMKYPGRIKGYDFPTALHKSTSTFWISFIGDKELYKIDLKKRKVEKIFKSCIDQKDCLQSPVLSMYEFDSLRILLKFNMAAGLLNPMNDSLTNYSDLFKSKLPDETYVNSFIYKDWLCGVTTTQINLQNMVTGRQKRLSLNQDFKWTLSPLFYVSSINGRGEMTVMSSDQRGFVRLNLDSVLYPPSPGVVHFSFIKLNEREFPVDSLLKTGSLRLKYNGYSSIQFRFSDYSLIGQDKVKYEYTLYNGGDTIWNRIEGDPELSFTKIAAGNHKLLIRAANGYGDYSPQVTAFALTIIPPFTQTLWFIVLLVMAVSAVLYGIYRNRLQQIRKLQTVRNNIASDLHDDIGSTLNSISIYSEVARQQAGKEIPALDMIGTNSRKIIESMSDIVWTINPDNDSFEKIILRMRSFAHQLLKAKKVEYTFEVDEKLNAVVLPMQVRKNFYMVFKEAINNLSKYSQASRVAVSLVEKNKIIILTIRDNGVGIPVNHETMGNGLLNMSRRAEEINAELSIVSGNGEGTAIELMLTHK